MNALKDITVGEITDIITVSANTGRKVKIEERATFGLTFCKSGKITYTYQGKKYLSTPECAVILPQAATYELHNNQGGEFPLINFSCLGATLAREFLVIPLDHTADYLSDFEKMKKLSMQNENRLKIMSIFYDLLGRLSEEYESRSPKMDRAVCYIIENIHRSSLNNHEIAAQVGVCESYLRRMFQECFRTTPKQYVLDTRMKKARQLLGENRKNVTQIAEECGFSSVYHFCRAFKTYSGITPSQYRSYHSGGW